MTRRTRIAALLSAWMALGVVASPIGTLIHTEATEHVWCETHQHLVHAGDAPARGPTGEGLSGRRMDAPAEEWACELAPASRREAVEGERFAGPRGVPHPATDARGPVDAAPQRPPLALAPKQGPPRA